MNTDLKSNAAARAQVCQRGVRGETGVLAPRRKTMRHCRYSLIYKGSTCGRQAETLRHKCGIAAAAPQPCGIKSGIKTTPFYKK